MAHSANLATVSTELQQQLACKAIHPETGELVEYAKLRASSDGPAWEAAAADEIGRLAQGNGDRVAGTDTIHFININDMPSGSKATYVKLVAADKPNKDIKQRIRMVVGGDRLDYQGDVSTKTANLETLKLLLNSVISTPGAKFMSVDIKDFYLNTKLPPNQKIFIRIPVRDIPAVIMEQYSLHDKIHNDYIYAKLGKGMYGLKEAGLLANVQLVSRLKEDGYHQTEHTPGLFLHESRPVAFSLIVDDFGTKYIGREHAEHLVSCLKKYYEITADWTGTKYCGLTLKWDYQRRTCDMSMPGYIEKALLRFAVDPPTRPQHSPHPWTKPIYGAKTQLTAPIDDSELLPPAELTRLQEIIGTLLYYARAVDSSLLPALGTLASAQAQGTRATAKACVQLLNYCATYPNTTIRFYHSDMILKVHSDASYLSESKARSRAAGYHYLGNKEDDTKATTRLNGAILVISKIMKEVLSSAAEAEIGALFYNGKEVCPLRTTLIAMGHPQPPTVIITDNSTAVGLANDTIKQRRSKAIDMRFYWIRDREQQDQFRIHWKPGSENRADYFSKHHPPSHHREMRTEYYVTDSPSGEGVFMSHSGLPDTQSPVHDDQPSGSPSSEQLAPSHPHS